MKTILKFSSFAFLFLFISTFYSCEDKIIESQTYKANVPEYMSYDDLRSSVKMTESTQLCHPGKMYFKDNYIFINEQQKGVHVYDNSNPASPVNLTFIEIPGNVDISIFNDILYADSYVDLVAIDISDINNVTEIYRSENIFEYTIPAFDFDYPVSDVEEQKGVVLGWKIENVTETIDIHSKNYNLLYTSSFEDGGAWNGGINSSGPASNSGGVGNSGSAYGVGGSMARFMIYSKYLYVLREFNMKTFDISNPLAPREISDINIDRVSETLFVYENNMFIGTQTGMVVYSLANPANPVYLSEFNHIQSCDPVVVNDGYAYVTLRAGNSCGGFENQLDVVDISLITNPVLVETYPLKEPYGLGIDSGTLFICDGDDGLKVYDACDPLAIDENMIKHFPDINAFDVIPLNDVLLMIGSDGLYQYDYSDLDNLSLLSVINVNNCDP
jgi:hypothetical protein